ncbi:hypothetical protein METBIDRAFT_36917 [Metschnikowia bicuspidata var. bicuspidata NRRL YB-4993]|uniref:Uncharacterized protein n=1 Tax=Metschnikowia bicuspidata var. bicuspidata NRRL YB-4993 TaxID=869754 RepID=A0A1A0HHJ4_9ASCO|nr:hypothetical protein METBIDRAFT_36917 [Metschnikowia bicuspidata var. bicuspidata NRRL YB-4993]OBA23475.1 hypothetical protein METBIDRAFT_36917 [Metschnikowia bicuspidata var. bicuspidata NRRL YB-4993]
MTYLIGDRRISLSGPPLSAEEQRVVRAHPRLFQACLNASAHRYLLSSKQIVHLYTDIVTIYSTLLLKIAHYDDVRAMAAKTRAALARLETDLGSVLGRPVHGPGVGWELLPYEAVVKKGALVVLQACGAAFAAVHRTLCCIDVFFGAFDNLKKLLVPCLATHTRMVQKLLGGAAGLLRLQTIVDQIGMLPELTPSVAKQLQKIAAITGGLEREARLLDMVFAAVNPSLLLYTAVLLGRAILKRDVAARSCQIVARRDVCYQAAEHVVSIPLSGSPAPSLYMYESTRHVLYFFSAVLVVVLAVLFRLYNVVFG